MAAYVSPGVCNTLFKLLRPSLVSKRGIKRYVRPTLQLLKKRDKIFREETDSKKLLELSKRSRFYEWNHQAEIYAFGKRLQEEFRLDLLLQAFTHKSYAQQVEATGIEVNPEDFKDNEELAAEGEKIITNHVWNYISHFFPRFPLEGIESVHSFLTSDSSLAHISRNLGTNHIILSGDYPVEELTYAKTFKAIVGALNESSGIDRTNLFVRDLVVTQLAGKDINDFLIVDNYFKVLSDILERSGKPPPEPRIICQSAINTILANYHVGIYCDKQLVGHCAGESIDVAIEMASLDVLKRFFCTTLSSSWIKYDAVLPNIDRQVITNIPLEEWSLSKFSSDQRVSNLL